MGAPRYPPSGPRPGVRMPQGIGNDFNGVNTYNTTNPYICTSWKRGRKNLHDGDVCVEPT